MAVKDLRIVASGVALALSLSGCRADRAPKPPELPTPAVAGLPQCQILPSQLRPMIVQWPGADRGSLEYQLQSGVVAVRYEGCALEVLRSCRLAGEYAYAGFNRKHDTVAIQDVDDLYTLMPSSAARLEPTLVRGQELRVDMTLVGMYTAGRTDFTRNELVGECEAATHVLTAAQVGAFSFYSGAASAIGETAGSQEVINTDGDPAACEVATTTDRAPPEGCGGLLRLELTPLPAVAKPVAVAKPPVRAAKRDSGARERGPRKHRRSGSGDAAVAFIWIGAILFGGGLISGGVWFANKVRYNNITFAMKEHEVGSATWQALNEQHKHYQLRTRVSGWTTAGAYLVGSPSLVLGIFAEARGGLARVGVTPIVHRSYGGLNLTFRF